jgi:programmed cell death 8 (apoptosis-inducing factor)
MPSTQISNLQPSTVEKGKISIKLSDGSELLADHVVSAVGVEPNTALAREAGLEIDEKHGGVIVNAELEARRNVYVSRV